MKRCLIALLSVLLASTPVLANDKVAAASAKTPDAICKDFYNSVTAEAQAILNAPNKNLAQKQADLSIIFNKTMDSDWIARFVLGRFWKIATPEEQKEYLALYKQYLTQIYVSKFNEDDLTNFELQLANILTLKNGDIVTKTFIKRPGQPDVQVDYAMTVSGKECRVRDIVIENVSLLTSQRSEFQSLANKSGVAGVIAALKRQIS